MWTYVLQSAIIDLERMDDIMSKYADLPEHSKKQQVEYKKLRLKRVPLDMQLDEYDRLKQAATNAGMPVNSWIKTAIREKMDRDR